MHDIDFKIINMDNLNNLENAIDAKTRLVWIESPSNPKMKITDIVAVVNICK